MVKKKPQEKNIQKPRRYPAAIRKQNTRIKLILHECIPRGMTQIEMAEFLGVQRDTIVKDMNTIFTPQEIEQESNTVRQQVNWSIKQAFDNYLKSKSASEKRKWLYLFNQMTAVRARYIRPYQVIVNQQNIEKVDIRVLLQSIKKPEKLENGS